VAGQFGQVAKQIHASPTEFPGTGAREEEPNTLPLDEPVHLVQQDGRPRDLADGHEDAEAASVWPLTRCHSKAVRRPASHLCAYKAGRNCPTPTRSLAT